MARLRKSFIAMLACLAISVFAADGYSAAQQEAITVPFQQELFELGYMVFLSNNNPADALKVAEKAISALPPDKVWRRKAAQAADWSGQPAKALEHWFVLSSSDNLAASRAEELARALNDHARLKQLVGRKLVKGSDLSILRDYIYISEMAGRPEDALPFLEKPMRGWDPLFLLEERSRLYEQLGMPMRSLAMLESISMLRPLKSQEALRGAAIWYGTGQPENALSLMQRAALSASKTEEDLWSAISDLAWGLDHRQEAVKASSVLIQEGHGRIFDYQRVIEFFSESDTEMAYSTALSGWERFRQPGMFFLLADVGQKLGRWKQLASLIKSLTVADRDAMGNDPQFWLTSAEIARQVGDRAASLGYSREALRRAPASPELVSAHIWLLLEFGEVSEALLVAEAWSPKARFSVGLGDAVGAAFAAAGDSSRALPFYRIGFPSHRNDPAWLAAYADILDQAGKSEAAYLSRLMAMQHLRAARGRTLEEDERREIQRMTGQVAVNLKPGDALDALMRTLANGAGKDPASRDAVLAWLLATEKQDMGRLWFFRSYLKSSVKPVWGELNLALEQNDRPELARLLDGGLDRLPYKDALEAARRTGRHTLAETLGFDRFQQNNTDFLLDAQVRELFLRRRDTVDYSILFLDQSGVGLLENRLAGSARLSNRWTFLVETREVEFTSVKSDALAKRPSREAAGMVGLSRRHEGGSVTLMAGMTSGLYNQMNLEIKGDHQMSSRIAANMQLRIGGMSEDNIPMRIGGLKDEVIAGLSISLDPRFTLSIRGGASYLKDQARRPLGESGGLDMEIDHRVVTAWPDFGVKLFGGYHNYNRSGMPQGRTLSMVPAEKNAADFFVPQSYGILGAGIFFGQDWKTAYTRDWKMFGELGASWNSVSKEGFRYELGVVGPLFGLDTMMFSLSQDSGAFGNSAITTKAEMKYRYRF